MSVFVYFWSYDTEAKVPAVVSAVHCAIADSTKLIKEALALHSGRSSKVRRLSSALERLEASSNKGMWDNTATGAKQAFDAAVQERAECLQIFSALQTLQNAVSSWDKETYKAG